MVEVEAVILKERSHNRYLLGSLVNLYLGHSDLLEEGIVSRYYRGVGGLRLRLMDLSCSHVWKTKTRRMIISRRANPQWTVQKIV